MQKCKLSPQRTALVIIDLQERLLAAMKQDVLSQVIKNVEIWIDVAQTLNLPILWTQQYSKGLGPTIPKLREKLSMSGIEPIEKTIFSCCALENFQVRLDDLQIEQVVLTGTETHICVLQTALDLLDQGKAVHVVSDACISRRKENWKAGLAFMQAAGAVVTSTEIAVFQLLKQAGTPEFKKISPLFRDM